MTTKDTKAGAREYWILKQNIEDDNVPIEPPDYLELFTHVIEYSAFQKQIEDFMILKLAHEDLLYNFDRQWKQKEKSVAQVEMLKKEMATLVHANYYALLEATAWMGIPDKKREAWINDFYSNSEFIYNRALKQLADTESGES